MLPEWIPAYEAHEPKLPAEARDKLLAASARTLDQLLQPLRGRGLGRSLTRPGTLLRHQIPIRDSVWEEVAPTAAAPGVHDPQASGFAGGR